MGGAIVIKITKKQYNYLLPAIRKNLYCLRTKNEDYYFLFGTDEEIKDAYRRLIGLSW